MRILIAAIFITLTTFLLTNYSHANDNISNLINTFYPDHKLLTFNDLDSFSKNFLSDFKPDIQPGIVMADFDGNDLSDFALFLNKKSKDGSIFCFLLQTRKDTFKSYEIIKYERMMDYVFLLDVKPNTLVKPTTAFDTGQSEVKLEFSGVELTYVGKASVVYYWDKITKQFESIQTSD